MNTSVTYGFIATYVDIPCCHCIPSSTSSILDLNCITQVWKPRVWIVRVESGFSSENLGIERLYKSNSTCPTYFEFLVQYGLIVQVHFELLMIYTDFKP